MIENNDDDSYFVADKIIYTFNNLISTVFFFKYIVNNFFSVMSDSSDKNHTLKSPT